MSGLLEDKVLCQYAWTQKALHEGPIYLEAWRKASKGLKATRKSSYYPYLPKNALDGAMGVFEMTWKKGWGPQSKDDTGSPALRLVQWVHTRDPHWISSHLDDMFFSSSMSVWDTLLYHDTSTSAWAMQQWPERLIDSTFAWNDWLTDTGPWMYPIFNKSYEFPKEQWLDVARHFSAWSPLQSVDPEQRVHKAVALIGFPGKDFRPHNSSHRGILWKALTCGAPPEITEPIGAALACTWPDMHPDCLAIKRHFYPELGNVNSAYDASLPHNHAFSANHLGSSGARATIFLYDSPQLWVQAMLDTWAHNPARAAPRMEIELPVNFLD